jgi:hypothetical protein
LFIALLSSSMDSRSLSYGKTKTLANERAPGARHVGPMPKKAPPRKPGGALPSVAISFVRK